MTTARTDSSAHADAAFPARLEARDKVTGAARYAADHHPAGLAYAWPVVSSIARGRITGIDSREALADPDTLLVLTHENAPRLAPPDDPMLNVLQSARIDHRGQVVALTVADSLEAARAAAVRVRVDYQEEPHDVLLGEDHPGLYLPEEVNGGHPAVRERGEPEAGLIEAPVRIDRRYHVPPLHNHPMEPHAGTAAWDGGRLLLYESSQGATAVQTALAKVFRLEPEQVEVVSEHVGGGFGSKGTPRPTSVLAAMAARELGRPVQIALPRRYMAALVGHRAETRHRIRIGAAPDGTIQALVHEVQTCTSQVKEFVEQAAVPARVMYRSPHSRTEHRVARLDMPTPSWMRAPGECPGMFALETAMDELAEACAVDPVELRIRNEPEAEPDSGRPFSSRHLTECLRQGARRFGWTGRGGADLAEPRPGGAQPGDRRPGGGRTGEEPPREEAAAVRADSGDRPGRRLVGRGVAAATYPVMVNPGRAEARAMPDGTFRILVNATDIGTGARTAMAQIAAESLGVDPGRIRPEIGNSTLPPASVAGGSSGTASWGWAVHKASSLLRDRLAAHGDLPLPVEGLAAEADTSDDIGLGAAFARHAFGAHFAEVRVDPDTGEVRVPRMLGVFAAGRILNPKLARSQLVGAMAMGLSMALTEFSSMDPEFGDHAQRDLASYHVAVQPDVPHIEAHWIEEDDRQLNPMGTKGIGELGIVGAAAAIANAVHDATGIRVRSLPVRPDALLPNLR